MNSNERNTSNETIDYLTYEESIGSSYSVSYNKKYPNNTGYDNNNNELNARLLLEDNQKSIKNTNKYIFLLIYLIICLFVLSTSLFAIYYFTQKNNILYYSACVCFGITIILSCCLCSCMKYRCELEKIQGPISSV